MSPSVTRFSSASSGARPMNRPSRRCSRSVWPGASSGKGNTLVWIVRPADACSTTPVLAEFWPGSGLKALERAVTARPVPRRACVSRAAVGEPVLRWRTRSVRWPPASVPRRQHQAIQVRRRRCEDRRRRERAAHRIVCRARPVQGSNWTGKASSSAASRVRCSSRPAAGRSPMRRRVGALWPALTRARLERRPSWADVRRLWASVRLARRRRREVAVQGPCVRGSTGCPPRSIEIRAASSTRTMSSPSLLFERGSSPVRIA